MSLAVAQFNLPESESLPPDALDQLAGTFENVRQAVWVHDNAGRCVYRNSIARRVVQRASLDAVQDILDYRDRRIGQLRVRSM
jgi:PAS domain-containing protein